MQRLWRIPLKQSLSVRHAYLNCNLFVNSFYFGIATYQTGQFIFVLSGAVVKGTVLQMCLLTIDICATRDSGFAPRLCRNREVRGATHNWPSVVWVREGLAGREILGSSHTSDSCGGPGAVRANRGCQVHGVSSDTLVQLASGLDGAVLRSSAAWLGCVSEDA